MSEAKGRPAAEKQDTGRKNRIYRVIGRTTAGLLTVALAVPGLSQLNLSHRGNNSEKTAAVIDLDLTAANRFGRIGRTDRTELADRGTVRSGFSGAGTGRSVGSAIAPDTETGIVTDIDVSPRETDTVSEGQSGEQKPASAAGLAFESGQSSSAALSGAPGAILYMNYQNYVIISDTEHDWFGSLPTQKGLYQINAEYRHGEGISFTFSRNNKRPDPMVYLPVYDICYNINLQHYPYIAVCYKSTTTDQAGHMYFATVQNEGLSEEKNIPIPMDHADDWTLSVVNASRNSNWTGRLTTLRFDIAGGDFNGDITVKWIGFFKTRDEANAFGTGGISTANVITPDKTEYARGEDIGFTVASYLKGDWVALVQEGDACCTGSVHRPDLYVSDVMPLYWETLDNEHCVFKMDETRGIFTRKLLPAGKYDLVFYSHGSYVELSRVTITVTDEIAREPETTERIIVTRAPETAAPETTEEIPAEPTGEPYIATVTPSPIPAKTQRPGNAGSAKKANRAGGTFALVCALVCAAALAVFFVLRKKRKPEQ